MKGAREYADLFETGQYGKLYITSGKHARGKTFRIQILPEGEVAKPNGDSNECVNRNAVLVYGVISGQRGWTEEYGWIYKGKWCDDFEFMVRATKEQIIMENELNTHLKLAKEIERDGKIKNLLEKY